MGGQGSANWDRRSGSGKKKKKNGRGAQERQGVLQPLRWATLLNDASLS